MLRTATNATTHLPSQRRIDMNEGPRRFQHNKRAQKQKQYAQPGRGQGIKQHGNGVREKLLKQGTCRKGQREHDNGCKIPVRGDRGKHLLQPQIDIKVHAEKDKQENTVKSNILSGFTHWLHSLFLAGCWQYIVFRFRPGSGGCFLLSM